MSDDVNVEGHPASGKPEQEQKVPQRKRKQSSYVVEMSGGKSVEDGKCEGWDVWFQLPGQWPSPEQALESVDKAKKEGVFRVVRVATPEYEASVVTPAPVWKMRKLGKASR